MRENFEGYAQSGFDKAFVAGVNIAPEYDQTVSTKLDQLIGNLQSIRSGVVGARFKIEGSPPPEPGFDEPLSLIAPITDRLTLANSLAMSVLEHLRNIEETLG